MKKSIDALEMAQGIPSYFRPLSKSHQSRAKLANILNFEDGLFITAVSTQCIFFKNIIKDEFDIFLDKLCHASIYDGILSAQSTYTRYPHLDYDFLSKN